MNPSRRFSILSWIVLIPLAAPAAAQPRRAQAACAQITAACRNAGFVQGGAQSGTGIMVDCVQPIMRGTAAPRKAAKPLPKIDPDVITACRTQNPQFGQAAQNAVDAAQPPPPPPPVLSAHPAAPGSPNIIFILTDDLAMNLVQFMPHVLAMQQKGVTFSHYFVSDSLCCPSRSSIFTGRYPHDTGVFKNVGNDGGYLVFRSRGNEQATFAVALSAAGYRTAFLAKYMNGYEPAHSAGPAYWRSAGLPQGSWSCGEAGGIRRTPMHDGGDQPMSKVDRADARIAA